MSKKKIHLFSTNLDILVVCCLLICGVFINFHTEGIVGSHIGPELYGDFAVTITIFNFIGQILIVGLDSIVAKYLPKFLHDKQLSKARFFILTFTQVIIITTIAWALVGILINLVAHKIVEDTYLANYIHPSFFFLGFAAVWALYYFLLKVLRALKYVILSVLLFQSTTLIFLLLLIKMQNITFETAIFANIISTVVIVTIVALIILFTFKNIPSRQFQFPQNIIQDSAHYVVQQILSFPPSGILLLIVEASKVPETDVGIVSVVFLISKMLLLVPNAIRNVFISKVALVQYTKVKIIKALLVKIRLISFFIISASALAIYYLSPYILALFGKDFMHAAHFIPLGLVISIPVTIIVGDLLFLNTHHHKSHYITYILFLRLVLTIAVGIVFIHLWEICGAILTYIFVESVNAILIFIASKVTLNDANYSSLALSQN